MPGASRPPADTTRSAQFRVIENASTNGARVTDSLYNRLGRLTQLLAYDGDAPQSPDPQHANAQTTTYANDLAGRMTLAQRGTAGNPDAVSRSDFLYNDLSQLTRETETLFEGSAKPVNYAYDPQGNRTALSYPPAPPVTLSYAYDAMYRVTAIDRFGLPLADYEYDGWLFTGRSVKTAAASDTQWIEHLVTYDDLRRIAQLSNPHLSPRLGDGRHSVVARASSP